jgi:hypothetical protein
VNREASFVSRKNANPLQHAVLNIVNRSESGAIPAYAHIL